jgi:hypothetical protein
MLTPTKYYNDTQHNDIPYGACHYAECHFPECCGAFPPTFSPTKVDLLGQKTLTNISLGREVTLTGGNQEPVSPLFSTLS